MIIPRRFAGIKRFEEIVSVLSRHGLDFLLEKVGLKKKRLFTKRYESRPVEVRMIFEELGGSFLKLGQFLSLRPDLIPKDYSEELAKLQDSVAPSSFDEVKHVVEHELKGPLKNFFADFEKTPVASASIGQVYRAKLKNKTLVAVKVMRPGIKCLVETDLEILEYLAKLFKQHINPKVFDPVEIFDEFRRYTENELDYMKELRNIKSFQQVLKGTDIVVPGVYPDLSTKSIIVMDFIEGVPLSHIIRSPGNFKWFDNKEFCRKLASCFLKQVFVNGVFHADPHPGNIFVSKKGIALLDFGIVGKIDDALKEKLGTLLIAAVNKDPQMLAEGIADLDISESMVDISSLKQDLSDGLGEYYDVPLDKMDIAGLFFTSLSIARKHKLSVPRDFVLLVKSLITLRAVCEQLDPKFNIVQECKPFIKDMVKSRADPRNILKRTFLETRKFAMFMQDMPGQARKVYGLIDKADFALDSINHDLSRLNGEIRREAVRVVLAVIISSLVVSASISMSIDKKLSTAFLVVASLLLAYLVLSIAKDHVFRRL